MPLTPGIMILEKDEPTMTFDNLISIISKICFQNFTVIFVFINTNTYAELWFRIGKHQISNKETRLRPRILILKMYGSIFTMLEYFNENANFEAG